MDKNTIKLIKYLSRVNNDNIKNNRYKNLISKNIDDILLPQEMEKKNAEVRTQYKLRNDMLDNMPKG